MAEFSISNNFPKVGGMDFKKFNAPEKMPSIATDSQPKESFASMVEKTLNDIESSQGEANQAIKDLAIGKNKNIHEVMMTLEKADTTLKLGMQIRNKVVDAYKEIMKMQV